MTLLTPEDVGERLGVSAQTVRRWIADGRVEAFRLPSGQYRIDEEQIESRLIPVKHALDSGEL